MGKIRRLWSWFWAPSARRSLGALTLIGFVLGIGSVIGFNTGIHMTGTIEFCGGACHSMRTFTLPEYQVSIHGNTRTGVTAGCSDCHLPHALIPKLITKTRAGLEDIYHEFAGTIDTKEEYEAQRLVMAQRVWAEMRATDSANCRHCHDRSKIRFEDQSAMARTAHEDAQKTGETCIDCHQGVAHEKPKMPDEAGEDDFSL